MPQLGGLESGEGGLYDVTPHLTEIDIDIESSESIAIPLSSYITINSKRTSGISSNAQPRFYRRCIS
jgi:hypothetical protein